MFKATHLVGYGCAICTPVPHVPAKGGGHRKAMITTEWHRARMGLVTPTNFNLMNIYVDGMEVGDARNAAVNILLAHSPIPEFIFFLDYDVVVPADALVKLFRQAAYHKDYDIFAGVYCVKSSSHDPLIYKGNGKGPHWDWAVGDTLMEGITGVHMGLTLIRSSLFERMEFSEENPLFKTVNEYKTNSDGHLVRHRGTEDLFFCDRAVSEVSAKIFVDTSVLAGHIDHSTGQIFGLPEDSPPVRRAHFLQKGEDKASPSDEPEKIALDIGAGEHPQTIDGHKVYTTDIRPGVGDYCMDTRTLNFPDNHWDFITSSHHLEHIGRWDQEDVWKEMFRITKPGGGFRHIVPNVRWAAEQIALEGVQDGHVMNVLYGAQESHGYEREYNTHFFGYTPELAVALAKQAGFENVETEDWKRNPDLGYNLVITGNKPAPEDDDEWPSTKSPSPITSGSTTQDSSIPIDMSSKVIASDSVIPSAVQESFNEQSKTPSDSQML